MVNDTRTPAEIGRHALPGEADITAFLARTHRPGPLTWAARRVLRPLLSDFSLNGLLGTYPLYLLETRHWEALFGPRPGGRLLDVGAAAGDVTAELAPLFDEVMATDVAGPMVRRLRHRGIDAHRVDLARHRAGEPPFDAPFDAVALLNVLDRCDDPHRLLDAAIAHCRPGGALLVSVPLPYDPWRYAGSVPRRPRRPLGLEGRCFDDDLAVLLDEVLPSAGARPERWLRTPYVSAGDRRRPEYRLPAAVVVCSL